MKIEYDLHKGYTIIDGFAYASINIPHNVHDAIVIRQKSIYTIARYSDTPMHTNEEYIEYINKKKIEKAIVYTKDVSFLTNCPSIKYLTVVVEYDEFDFSPLYGMSQIKKVNYVNGTNTFHTIDYSKFKNLEELGLLVSKGIINFNKIETLKNIVVTNFKGENYDLTDLFCSKNLIKLEMITCKTKSLEGIQQSEKIQCVYLSYMRSLTDISALAKVKDTLQNLAIECCPKINDFSVLAELKNLEYLSLEGKNILPNLDFIKKLPKLKLLVISMPIEDGDLTPCLKLEYASITPNKRHYNLKNEELPKNIYCGDPDYEEWRKY